MINVGVIGTGYWGPNIIRNFNEIEGYNLKWVCDLDEKKLKSIKSRYKDIKTTTDYRKLIKDPELDAVAISTPVTTHFEIAKGFLKNKKHVFVEKELTNSSKNALELIEIAKKNKKILMVGHTFRFNSSLKKIKEYIEKGLLGDILYMHSSRTGLGPVRKDINVMWDLSGHDISVMLYLLEKYPKKVVAHGQSYIQSGIEDVTFLMLYFPNNVIVNIHISWLDPIKIRKMTIVGTKKMLVFDDVSLIEKIKIFDKGISYEKPLGSYGDFNLSVRDGDITIPRIPINEPLKDECLHFLECIKKNKKPITDGYEGYVVTKILEAAQESLKNNSKVVNISI